VSADDGCGSAPLVRSHPSTSKREGQQYAKSQRNDPLVEEQMTARYHQVPEGLCIFHRLLFYQKPVPSGLGACESLLLLYQKVVPPGLLYHLKGKIAIARMINFSRSLSCRCNSSTPVQQVWHRQTAPPNKSKDWKVKVHHWPYRKNND